MVDKFTTWLAVGVVLWAMSTGFVGLRLLYRWRKTQFRAADYCTVAAWFCNCFFLGAWIYYAKEVFVANPWLTPNAARLDGVRLDRGSSIAAAYMLVNLSHTIVVPLIKVSILLLLLSLKPARWHKIALQCLLAFCILRLVIYFFLALFGCYFTTSGALWSIPHPHTSGAMMRHTPQLAQCIPQRNVILSNSITNAVVEVLIFLLSMPFVINIRTSFSAKVGLTLGFSMGLVTIAGTVTAAVFALLTWSALEQGDAVGAGNRWFASGISAAVEVNVSLAIASILPLRSLLVRKIADLSSALGITKQVIQPMSRAMRQQRAQRARRAGGMGGSGGGASMAGSVDGDATSLEPRSRTMSDAGSCEYLDTLKWPMPEFQFPDLNTLRRGSVVALQRVRTNFGGRQGSADKSGGGRAGDAQDANRGSLASLWSIKSWTRKIDEKEVDGISPVAETDVRQAAANRESPAVSPLTPTDPHMPAPPQPAVVRPIVRGSLVVPPTLAEEPEDGLDPVSRHGYEESLIGIEDERVQDTDTQLRADLAAFRFG